MKTKEFIEKVKELGFEAEKKSFLDGEILKITLEDRTVARVSCNSKFNIVTNYEEFENLLEQKKKELFDLIVEYSSTPTEEREEEKFEMIEVEEEGLV